MSPIKPENKARYPQNWKTEIVPAVRARSGNQYECRGECGSYPCTTMWMPRCPEIHGKRALYASGAIVLTTAHLDHQPEHNDLANLRHFCQRCHLNYDRKHHAESRRRTGEQRTGQQNLLSEAAR